MVTTVTVTVLLLQAPRIEWQGRDYIATIFLNWPHSSWAL